MKLINKIIKETKSCMVIEREDNICIYSLGFVGVFPEHRFFVNASDKKVCSFCKHRVRNQFGECSLKDFCMGFSPIKDKEKKVEPFDKSSLFSLLINEGYQIEETHENVYQAYTNCANAPIIFIHILS